MTSQDASLTDILADRRAFAAWARARLLAEPVGALQANGSPSDFDLNPEAEPRAAQSLQPAAVLIPIIAAIPLSVLLTQRTEHLPSHARVDRPEHFGHSPYLERPGAVTKRILAFLEDLVRARAA